MPRPIRIVTGGIHHETNSFTPIPTTYADFQIDRGTARYADETGMLAPFDTIDLAATFVANAQPGGLVQHATYQRLKDDLLAELAAALPVDGVLLDLHGAMEVETIGDGESDLIRAVRELVGDEMPVAVSLDLHGNISPELVARADILTAYRTAPHRDVHATRRRALGMLVRAIESGQRPVSAMVKLPLILAGEAAVTDVEPAHSLYARLESFVQMPGILDASILIGCAWTDSRYARVSAIVVAESDAALAQREAERLAREVWDRRRDFGYAVQSMDADAAIAEALANPVRPVYLSDSGDNVTAGAPGDSPLFLARLLAAGATDALVAGLVDAEAVQVCVEAGVGAAVQLKIGATLDPRGGPPVECTALVESLSDESTALVRIDGVRVILTSARRAFIERATITAAGIDPQAQQIVVVKLGYLFPDLAAHAARAILALTPGATSLRLDLLPYRQVEHPVFPLDPDL